MRNFARGATGGICLSRRPFNLSNAIWRCEFEDYRPINGPSPPVGPPTPGKRKWRSLRLPGDQLPSLYGKVTAPTPTAPLWTQDQAIAYEAALEAINDVIAGYSEQIALEHGRVVPNTARIAWLEMRTDQASATGHALNVMDDENVRQTLLEYSAIVRARDGAG